MEKNKLLQNYKKYLVYLPLVLLALFFPFLLKNFSYGLMFLCFCEMYIIAVNGLDLVYGYSGQITFATAAFFGLGSYGSLLLRNHTGLPVIVCMLLAAVITCIIGMILAYPVSKLRFAFLSLSTISFNHVVFQLATRSPGGITGDYTGAFTDSLTLFGIDFGNYTYFYYFGLACVVIFVILKFNLVRSRVGRAFLAIKQNTAAADGMGINVRKYKVYAFGIYAFYAAFAGTMYAHFVGYVSPETIAQQQSVIFMIMILLGGVTSNWGPIIGAVTVLLLKEVLGYAEQYQLLAYGIILLIFILFLPTGLYGLGKDLIENKKHKKGSLSDVRS